MPSFTPLASTIGGLLLGVAACAMLYFNGRITGISGIAGGLLTTAPGERAWRGAFLLGLLAGGFALRVAAPGSFEPWTQAPLPVLLVAGVLVGYGTRLGNGCTSGHGVCGLARRSKRSLAATATFMATAAATVFVVRHVAGHVARHVGGGGP